MNVRAVPRTHLATAALTAIALFAVAMRGGGFDVVERHVIGILAWLFVLGSLPFVQRPRRPVVLIGCALLAFALFTGLSAFWSESAERSVLELTRTLAYMGLFLAGAIAAQRIGTPKPIVAGLTVGFGAILLMAALSRLEPALFPTQEIQQARPEVQARLTYPLNYWNGVAALAAMAVPFFLYLATNPALRPRVRALGTAAFPLVGLVLYLTFSRGGAGAAVLAAAIFLLASPTRWAALRPLLIGAVGTAPLVLLTRSYRELNDGLIESDAARSQGHRVLALLVVVTLAAWALSPLLERVDIRAPRLPNLRTRLAGTVAIVVAATLGLTVVALADVSERWESFRTTAPDTESGQVERRYLSASGSGRYEYWSASVDALESRPFAGRGAGTWEYWWQRHATVDGFVRDSHSLIFDVVAELGVPGLLLILAVFGTVIWAAVAARRRATGDAAALTTCLLAALAAFTLSAAIDWTWEIPALAGTFFVIAGLAAASGSYNGRGAPVTRRLSASIRAGAAFALFAWLVICMQALPLLSNWQLRASEDAFQREQWDRARKKAESARSLTPWAVSPNIQLALVLRSSGTDEAHAALEPAREAVRQEPTNWQTWFTLANVENTIGDFDAYREHLTIARALNPRSSYWQRIGFTLPPEELPR